VVVIPGEVVASEDALDGVLADCALCHALGVRLVLVVGCAAQINTLLALRGLPSRFARGVRVTDSAAALAVVCEAAGSVQLTVAAALSKGPPVPAMRKHGDLKRHHGAPALRVACGNFVAAKRRGVVGGVDFGDTGEVRHIDADALNARLDSGDVALLSNLGYSAAGEVLNCATWEVAAAAAHALKADKMISFARDKSALVTSSSSDNGGELLRWLPLREAEAALAAAAARSAAQRSDGAADASADAQAQDAAAAATAATADTAAAAAAAPAVAPPPPPKRKPRKASAAAAAASPAHDAAASSPSPFAPPPAGAPSGPAAVVASVAAWRAAGAPLELAVAVAVCRAGVPRCHVLDASVEGALLLELYTCDGIGTMVSRDRYEGTRPATLADAPRIAALLAPLEADGTLARRDKAKLLADIGRGCFTVVERDGKVVGSAALVPFAGEAAAEVAAFAVDARYRSAGRGDALLEYVELRARAGGAKRLFLLTTRTADWFQQRGFAPAGRAAGNSLLPRGREVDAARNSLLFVKSLQEAPPAGPPAV
jgi:amino-acid N-acetyltransferase